jgi:hypothetical protein
LRAVVKIGELSRELDKHQGFDIPDTDDGNVKTKTEVLEQAGINLRTAERYEELAGPREEQAQQAATDNYLVRSCPLSVTLFPEALSPGAK